MVMVERILLLQLQLESEMAGWSSDIQSSPLEMKGRVYFVYLV